MRSLAPLVALAAVATLTVACCRAAPEPPADPAHVVDPRTHAERAEARSVALLDEDGDPNCGGVWVGRARIVTAYHCVDEAGKPMASAVLKEFGLPDPYADWSPVGQKVPYMTPDASRHAALVEAVDADHDLALLNVLTDIPEHDIAPVTGRFLRDGEAMDVVGSTFGHAFTYSRCYVASTRDTAWLQLSGPIYLGNSGGGAFDDSGRLVGIADKMVGSQSRGIVPDMSFFIPADVIRGFLSAADAATSG